jgi:hypothetical protein
VYTLMAGRDNYTFRSRGKTFATMTKRYTDDGVWKEEFGQQIDVLLESTVKPAPEFLVPFERAQEILREEGFELEDTKSFSEIYSGQTAMTLERGEQDFSFLYRTFVFKRTSKPVEASAPAVSLEDEEMPPLEIADDIVEVLVDEETPEPPEPAGVLTARYAGLRIQGRLLTSNKSPYSLDNPEHVRALFSKDWRTAGESSAPAVL